MNSLAEWHHRVQCGVVALQMNRHRFVASQQWCIHSSPARAGWQIEQVCQSYTRPVHQQHQTFITKSYDIFEDGDHAVIVFGNKEGWDNAPFLFCRTQAGWQFDLVHQRRFIRMGPSPTWGVEFGEHPYMDMLWDAFRFYGFFLFC